MTESDNWIPFLSFQPNQLILDNVYLKWMPLNNKLSTNLCPLCLGNLWWGVEGVGGCHRPVEPCVPPAERPRLHLRRGNTVRQRDRQRDRWWTARGISPRLVNELIISQFLQFSGHLNSKRRTKPWIVHTYENSNLLKIWYNASLLALNKVDFFFWPLSLFKVYLRCKHDVAWSG